MDHRSRAAASRQQLFIADLHLQASEPATLALAQRFIEQARGTASLWILGDLVEHWIGDDDDATWLQPFINAVRSLAASGCAVHLLHGNRDFLIGDALAARLGATLHREDSRIIRLGSRSVLLMHGDTLCTDDTDYQHLRLKLRDEAWQRGFIAQSLDARRQIARSLREESQVATAGKAASITDVNTQAVCEAMQAADCDLLIHGHTHRPDRHTVSAPAGERIVVGDWHPQGAIVARWTGSTIRLERISPSAPGGTPLPSGG